MCITGIFMDGAALHGRRLIMSNHTKMKLNILVTNISIIMETNSRMINANGIKSKYYRDGKNSSHSNSEPFTTHSFKSFTQYTHKVRPTLRAFYFTTENTTYHIKT